MLHCRSTVQHPIFYKKPIAVILSVSEGSAGHYNFHPVIGRTPEGVEGSPCVPNRQIPQSPNHPMANGSLASLGMTPYGEKNKSGAATKIIAIRKSFHAAPLFCLLQVTSSREPRRRRGSRDLHACQIAKSSNHPILQSSRVPSTIPGVN